MLKFSKYISELCGSFDADGQCRVNLNTTAYSRMLQSKLPNTGTTIFSRMTALADSCGAINLAQGFPDYSCSPQIVDLVTQAMQLGHNQYAPMPGLLSLRQAVAHSYLNRGLVVDPETELTITPGATAALFTAIATLVHPGDEVVVLTPAYDCYVPAILTVGGVPRTVPLDVKTFTPNWQAIRDAVSKRTRLLIVNTPHNPTGTVWSSADVETLAQLCEEHDIYILSDEVYDRIVFEPFVHVSPFSVSALRDRTIVVTSFGKTFHVTGWKVGCLLASQAITSELRKVHQYLSFSVHTPTQHALAHVAGSPHIGTDLQHFFTHKRNLFRNALDGSMWDILPCCGTYFQLLGYRSSEPDVEMAEQCTLVHGVAAIPLSPFMYDASAKDRLRYLRFCFAKEDETLLEAASRLKKAG